MRVSHLLQSDFPAGITMDLRRGLERGGLSLYDASEIIAQSVLRVSLRALATLLSGLRGHSDG